MTKREDKIINFFSELLHSNDQELDVNTALNKSMEIFDEITHVMKEGNQEEQTEVLEALEKVNKNIQEQFDDICEKAGVSKEDIQAMIQNPNNFKPEMWDALQGLQGQVDSTYSSHIPEKKPAKAKKVKLKTKQWITA
ncbi:MAG: hypothetical protein COT84_00485 [Chlamydiae bacterium CG10_big_fil_rev_8_21_14_0_10_35_9]|nr:MAG: hypothetical protein COT84_00485 [Chlamydiae bacterium CG10_big_fil_rev_8_21_14_0_10_35_9]